jgi:hypothetical protein
VNKSLTVEREVHFNRTSRGRGYRKELRVGPKPEVVEPGRVPRVARLMALAIRFDRLIRNGEIANYAELARLGHVTTARVTQIMNLLNLAPDVQEQLLFLLRTVRGRDPIVLRDLQSIAQQLGWEKQRALWRALLHQDEATPLSRTS